MIVIHGDIRPAAGDMAAFEALVTTLMAETRKEDGCLLYVFARDISDPGRIQLTELWRDAATLEAHLNTPHIKAFREAAAKLGKVETKITRYEAREVPHP